ncbi:acetate/propionate family kinase [Mycoplasma sp. SG1]|uniref:acetate/propionate family kinase n=1 Tax=Mycoplasma sp. SG1 TaxID=2810348 RepID=UPI002024A615|nr:acetate/propionate family kinase [Mycoplasma sp. SG1]URM52839.1 acetate/propionate family kinase [Mycoplasma sp. SG1]
MKNSKYILVVNSGSSSIKIALFKKENNLFQKIIFSNCQALNYENCEATLSDFRTENSSKKTFKLKNYSLSDAIKFFINFLLENNIISNKEEIDKIGHRFVQGGEIFKSSSEILEKDYHIFEELNPLAPLHNPANFLSYKIFKKELPWSRHVAVFDTSFHQTISPERFIYPIPIHFYKKYKIRKYGFHGSSYRYILEKSFNIFNKKELNLIICHIGAGSSIVAVEKNKAVNTTMGISPLGGLMMGTRSGDLDPSVLQFMAQRENLDIEKVIKILNNQSGLKGVSDFISGDLREILAKKATNKQANLAWNMFVDRIVDFIGQYYFQLCGQVDGIVLTAGIGENSKEFQNLILERINKIINLNIVNKKIDDCLILAENEKTKFLIIPTNEEIVIAKDTDKILK